MKKNLRAIALASVAALAISGGLAWASGIFIGIPQLSGTQVLTGNEIVPADTQRAQGINPATITLTLAQMGMGYSIVTTGTTGTIPNNVSNYILNGVGSTFTATLPSAPLDGQIVRITNTTSTSISSFTVSANTGQTITSVAPTALTASATVGGAGTVSYIYNAATAVWYKF